MSVSGHKMYWTDNDDGVLCQTRLVEFFGERRTGRSVDPPLPLWWGAFA